MFYLRLCEYENFGALFLVKTDKGNKLRPDTFSDLKVYGVLATKTLVPSMHACVSKTSYIKNGPVLNFNAFVQNSIFNSHT